MDTQYSTHNLKKNDNFIKVRH